MMVSRGIGKTGRTQKLVDRWRQSSDEIKHIAADELEGEIEEIVSA